MPLFFFHPVCLWRRDKDDTGDGGLDDYDLLPVSRFAECSGYDIKRDGEGHHHDTAVQAGR